MFGVMLKCLFLQNGQVGGLDELVPRRNESREGDAEDVYWCVWGIDNNRFKVLSDFPLAKGNAHSIARLQLWRPIVAN